MPFHVDARMHWTDHYVEHGFAVIKGLVGPEFTGPALHEVRQAIGHAHVPLPQWQAGKTPTRTPVSGDRLPVCQTLYDQPGIREMIATMFGGWSQWNGERSFQVFINPFDPAAPQQLAPAGHLDFVNSPIPIFGSGFMFQVSLVSSEPFSGNLTLYPGSHKVVQRLLVEDPDRQYPTFPALQEALVGEPYEFVAEPGDVCLFHHLVGHAGNVSHADERSPRVALHCQGLRQTWLRELDPACDALCPWARSLAFTGGKYRTREDEYEWIMRYRRERTARQ